MPTINSLLIYRDKQTGHTIERTITREVGQPANSDQSDGDLMLALTLAGVSDHWNYQALGKPVNP